MFFATCVEREQDARLLDVRVVARPPLDRPAAAGSDGTTRGSSPSAPARTRRIRAVALHLVEPADRVVPVRNEEHVVRRPAVVEPVRPHAGTPRLVISMHVVLREHPPLVHGDRSIGFVVGTGSRRGVQIGLSPRAGRAAPRLPLEVGLVDVAASARGTAPCRRGCCRAGRICPSTSAGAAAVPARASR